MTGTGSGCRTDSSDRPEVAIVGGGPAGLFAAFVLAAESARAAAPKRVKVRVHEAKPGFGRKFLVAGVGGLNLTNVASGDALIARYASSDAASSDAASSDAASSDAASSDAASGDAGPGSAFLADALRAFGPDELRAFAADLGIATFEGTSGRVFPREQTAAAMLRAWLARLRELGVELRPKERLAELRHDGTVAFDTPDGRRVDRPSAVVLALGGASWPRTGSDAGWVELVRALGVRVAPFAAANCGFEVAWSERFRDRLEGEPLKNVRLDVAPGGAGSAGSRGEVVVTRYGIEGGGVYDVSRALRLAVEREGRAVLGIDLKPDVAVDALADRLARGRVKDSLGTRLRKRARLSPVAAALVAEPAAAGGRVGGGDAVTLAGLRADPAALARRVKGLPLEVGAPRPIAEAISSAGGIALGELDAGFALRRAPHVHAIGEMLDWEAPTGGFLLQGCFATAHAAATSILARLGISRPNPPAARSSST